MGDAHKLFGFLKSAVASFRDTPAAPTPPMQIPGARSASQLCMLCKDANLPSGPEMEAIMRAHAKPAKRHVQLKADGIRALYIDGRIVSREGAPLDCALHCLPGLQRMEQASGLGPLFIDGEYVAEDGFAATLDEHKRKRGEGVFWAFDVIPLEHWRQGRSHWPIEQRLETLRWMITHNCDSLFVGMLDSWLLDPQETAAKAREIWAAGGEGVVSKKAGSTYVRERSDDWLRITDTITATGPIVDMLEKKDGSLRALIVRTAYGPITVGTGWTAAEGRTLIAMHRGALAETSMHCQVAFKLTSGAKRLVRGARFLNIMETI